MKQLLVTIFFFTSFISHAQWLPGEYVDDLGNGSGDTYLYQVVMGEFSYPSTSCGLCGFFFQHIEADSSFFIQVYPYDEYLEKSWEKSSFQEVQLIKPSGNVAYLQSFCTEGGILFIEGEYIALIRSLEEKGEYIFSLVYHSAKGPKEYRFSFEN